MTACTTTIRISQCWRLEEMKPKVNKHRASSWNYFPKPPVSSTANIIEVLGFNCALNWLLLSWASLNCFATSLNCFATSLNGHNFIELFCNFSELHWIVLQLQWTSLNCFATSMNFIELFCRELQWTSLNCFATSMNFIELFCNFNELHWIVLQLHWILLLLHWIKLLRWHWFVIATSLSSLFLYYRSIEWN